MKSVCEMVFVLEERGNLNFLVSITCQDRCYKAILKLLSIFQHAAFTGDFEPWLNDVLPYVFIQGGVYPVISMSIVSDLISKCFFWPAFQSWCCTASVVVILLCRDGVPKLQVIDEAGTPWASLLVCLSIRVVSVEHI